MITSLLKSLTKTLIIELIISIILGIKNKDDIKVVICANIITNPVIVYITNCIMLFNNMILYFFIVIILEIIVFIVEFIIYKKCLKFDKISPIVISLINNLSSFGIGVIINTIK